MKKILFTIAIVLTIGLTANAQGNDSFVDWSDDWNSGRTWDDDVINLIVPVSILGSQNDDPGSAPLGSGLLVLTALGAGYAVARRRKK